MSQSVIKSPALLIVGRKYRELAEELLNCQCDEQVGVVQWLPEDGLVLTDFPAYLTFDVLMMPWRIGTFALSEFRKKHATSNSRIILLTGAKQAHCDAIESANIFDAIVQVSAFNPPTPNSVLRSIRAVIRLSPNLESITPSGKIAYFDYLDPYFSSNSTVQHLDVSEGSRWANDSVPENRQLTVCNQILHNWKWRNKERNEIMNVKPFFGEPGHYPGRCDAFCFVLLPFEEPYTLVYEDHIKKVVESSHYECGKADDFYAATDVMKDIWRQLNRASLIVADVSTRNPNVMYEIGLAHTVGKPVILLTQTIDAIPFDLRGVRHILYEYTPRGCRKLEERLVKAIEETAEDYKSTKGNENWPNSRYFRAASLPPRFEE